MIRGQKFEIDLSDDEQDASQQGSVLPAAFVGDILERKPAAPKPPSAPVVKSKGGFPEHKKRNFESRFKQQKAATKTSTPASEPSLQISEPKLSGLPGENVGSGKAKSWEEEEKERIDQENRAKLAQMSPEEIEEERRELMQSLSPAFIQRLLQKSTIESGSEESDLSRLTRDVEPEAPTSKSKTSGKTVTFADEEEEAEQSVAQEEATFEEDAHDDHDHSATSLPHDSVHFPRPPQPPSLDPSSDTFFEDLHQKYFPSLPSDPEKLEWMQASTPSTKNSYDPSASALSAKDIRFSFTGSLIPPKTASEIPVTAGLHHHGDAPDAAGYTIAELAHLSRSSYPAQRCIAFQTLGRILYRLGQGEFGDAGEPGGERPGAEDTFGELARGLWREVDRLQVVKTLVDESEGRGVDGGRHVSAKAYATEAVWLWQKGGGRTWSAE